MISVVSSSSVQYSTYGVCVHAYIPTDPSVEIVLLCVLLIHYIHSVVVLQCICKYMNRPIIYFIFISYSIQLYNY